MGFQTDFSPVDYLKRRVAYYKKQLSRAKVLIKDENMRKKYGAKKLKEIMKLSSKRINDRIQEYEDAIKILSQPTTLKP